MCLYEDVVWVVTGQQVRGYPAPVCVCVCVCVCHYVHVLGYSSAYCSVYYCRSVSKFPRKLSVYWTVIYKEQLTEVFLNVCLFLIGTGGGADSVSSLGCSGG